MKETLARLQFRIVVFVSGACVLALEVVALRILEPYFGTTLYSISSVLSVVLLALSAGYALGGRLAEHPSRSGFFRMVAAGGYAVLLLVILRAVLLPKMGLVLPLSYGPLVASLVLFFLPNFLLGVLSPYAIQLEVLERKTTAGRTAGDIFFWSTLGSIFGSLLTGFVLIPHVGLTSVLVGIGVLLAGMGILFRLSSVRRELLVPLVLLLLVAFVPGPSSRPGTLYAHEGIYESVEVRDTSFGGQAARFLSLGGAVAAGMLRDSPEQAFDYTKYYALYRVLHPEIVHALVIGAGAYTVPKALTRELPNVEVDVADIEPLLEPIAQRYFGLDDVSRIHSHLIDGRRMLAQRTASYDFIYSDVYYTLYSVPPHFTTLEFFQEARRSLTPGGIFVANIIGSLKNEKQSLILSEMRTFQEVFPNSYFFAVSSPEYDGMQNIMFVGVATDTPVDWNAAEVRDSKDKTLREAAQHRIDVSKYDLASHPFLTDEYAPTEYLTSRLFRTTEPAKDSFF